MVAEDPILVGLELDTMTVYYLPKRIERGEQDGSNPKQVAIPERSEALPVFETRKALE